jgi:hypothetical protein
MTVPPRAGLCSGLLGAPPPAAGAAPPADEAGEAARVELRALIELAEGQSVGLGRACGLWTVDCRSAALSLSLSPCIHFMLDLTSIFGASVSEAAMRPNPRQAAEQAAAEAAHVALLALIKRKAAAKDKVGQTPRRPRSWANCSLYSCTPT